MCIDDYTIMINNDDDAESLRADYEIYANK